MEKIVVKVEEARERLDKVLSSRLEGKTRAYIQKIIKDGAVFVDGKVVAKVGLIVKAGQKVLVTFPELKKIEAKAEKMDLDVLYEDDDIIVVNKPAGMVVHPSESGSHTSGTLVNALLAHCGAALTGISGELRPGIVHRLDKNTSGILVIAKTDLAQQSLMKQFKNKSVKKKYVVLVKGKISPSRAVIDSPIGRSYRDRKKMAISSVGTGRGAVTEYKLNKFCSDEAGIYSLLDIDLKTGRTHQIRVHMNAIGYPVVGDITYGDRKTNTWYERKYGLKRQFLHAKELTISHPKSGKRMKFVTEIPSDLKRVLVCFES